jgi:ABC-2 type transport system permease protein
MRDITLMVRRSLSGALRQPAALIPNIVISVFFLFVYNAGLSSVSKLPGFQGTYLGFILPVAIVSAAVGGAGYAGQAIIRDIGTGYFTKLLLTPTSRLALVVGPIISGAILLVSQVVLIIVVALVMGLKSAAGLLGLVIVVVYAFFWGMAFAGYAVWIALRTKNAAAAQAGTLAFFPLIFLSATFVPLDYITVNWLKVVATINPTTYVFAAMRSLLNVGWEPKVLATGFAVVLATATVTGFAALSQARKATQLTK